MTSFARIQCDGYHACGVFQDGAAGMDVLFDCAVQMFGVDMKPDSFLMTYKPTDSMDDKDRADAGAMVVGVVVVLNAH